MKGLQQGWSWIERREVAPNDQRAMCLNGLWLENQSSPPHVYYCQFIVANTSIIEQDSTGASLDVILVHLSS